MTKAVIATLRKDADGGEKADAALSEERRNTLQSKASVQVLQ